MNKILETYPRVDQDMDRCIGKPDGRDLIRCHDGPSRDGGIYEPGFNKGVPENKDEDETSVVRIVVRIPGSENDHDDDSEAGQVHDPRNDRLHVSLETRAERKENDGNKKRSYDPEPDEPENLFEVREHQCIQESEYSVEEYCENNGKPEWLYRLGEVII